MKVSGGIVTHIVNELDIRCLPADLPEFIEVDLSQLTVAHSLHVRELALPRGVELSLKGTENPPVAAAQIPKLIAAEEEVAAEVVAETPAASEVPTVKQQAKPEGEPVEDKKGGKAEKKAEKK